jgi:nicotinamidase-related amidase
MTIDINTNLQGLKLEAEKTDGPITHPEDTLPNNGAELPGVPYEELQPKNLQPRHCRASFDERPTGPFASTDEAS